MEKSNVSTLVGNIIHLNTALQSLEKVTLENAGDMMTFHQYKGYFNSLLSTLVEERKTRDLSLFRDSPEGETKQPVRFVWWFYPKISTDTSSLGQQPIQLSASSSFKFAFWIDALDAAVKHALKIKMLKHTRQGNYVLMLMPECAVTSYQLSIGKTALQSGVLPHIESPYHFKICGDLLASIYSMQLYLDKRDVNDCGPTGFTFIIALGK